ncbi:MAG: CsgG/HfaB family protein [Halothiobacillaceae bacterium]
MMVDLRALGVARWRRALPLVGMLALAGCADIADELTQTYPATMTAVSEQSLQLRRLPEPTHRVSVAVYDLPDLTGQYKERETVQTMSRAVSQGGGALLVKALQDAGERRWFTVLDRTNLDNLLRERQIVTEMRRLYRGESAPDPDAIPPLRHAGILIQGAVVGYDTNTQTGGFGARYLGIGGDTQWKLDIVTVNLQAVSTNSGEVLASVMVQKPIASASARGGVFRYVELDKLLEVETGVAANEPKQLALQMAVEKAVFSLVLEGAEVGLWKFADGEAGRELVARHRAEKYRGAASPDSMRRQALPDTRNPARVVSTRPASRPEPQQPDVRQRVLPPETRQAPPSPPPGEEDEVIG